MIIYNHSGKTEVGSSLMSRCQFLISRSFLQAFVKTAATIYKKIQDGVFDVSNEVRLFFLLKLYFFCIIIYHSYSFQVFRVRKMRVLT